MNKTKLNNFNWQQNSKLDARAFSFWTKRQAWSDLFEFQIYFFDKLLFVFGSMFGHYFLEFFEWKLITILKHLFRGCMACSWIPLSKNSVLQSSFVNFQNFHFDYDFSIFQNLATVSERSQANPVWYANPETNFVHFCGFSLSKQKQKILSLKTAFKIFWYCFLLHLETTRNL